MNIKNVEWDVMLSGCWLCSSHKPAKDGYPYITRKFQRMSISRYMWINRNGLISSDLHLLHHCDNKLCVNPSHLYLGTNAQNMIDKAVRDHGGMKLSNADVIRIRELKGKMKSKNLALYYGVNSRHITAIWSREERKYI